MTYSILNWQRIDAIPSQRSLLLEWSTPIEEVDVWTVSNPCTSVSSSCFRTFSTIPTRFPLTIIDLCWFFDLVLPPCSRRYLLRSSRLPTLNWQVEIVSIETSSIAETAHLTPAWNPKLIFGVTDSASIFRSAEEEPISLVPISMPVDGEHFLAAGQAEAGNRLDYWLRKTSTAQKADRAGRVPAATDIVKTEIAVQGINC